MVIPPIAETRKHKRYKAQDGTIAFSLGDRCKLTDISEGGVALACVSESNIPPSFSLYILMNNNKFQAKLPVKLVWEKEIELSPSSSIFTKSIGVEFDNLTGEEKAKVDFLIKIHQEFEA